MKRFKVLFTLLVLLTTVFALSQEWSSLAKEPEPIDNPTLVQEVGVSGGVSDPAPRLPRHRVGHRAKVDDLDALMNQGALSDPLGLNRRLIEEGELIAAGQQGSDLIWEVYDVLVEDNPGTGQSIETQSGADNIDVTVGDLDGIEVPPGSGLFEPKGGLEYVSVWESTDQHLMLSVRSADSSLSFTLTEPIDTGDSVVGDVRVATDDFDADGLDEMVVGWKGHLKLYDTQGGLDPIPGDMADQLPHSLVDLTTGDFDGDGDYEILAACGDVNIPTLFTIYDINTSEELVEKTSASLPYPAFDSAVTTGDLDGDATDEIAVAAITTQGGDMAHDVMAFAFQANQSLDTLTQASESILLTGVWTDQPTYYTDFGTSLDIAAGDMVDITGEAGPRDEVYVIVNGDSYMPPDNRDWWVRDFVLTAEDDLNLSSQMLSLHTENGEADVAAAVGDLNMDRKAEVVLSRHSGLQVLQLSDDSLMPSFLSSLFGTWRSCLVIGDFNSDGPRIGPPTYSVVPDVREIQIIINAPPTHYDVISDTVHDVNDDDDRSYVSYAHQETENSEMISTSTRDWGLSAGLTGAYEYMGVKIEASLKSSYGEHFESTTREFESVTLGESFVASADDRLYRVEAVYDVWEYPVYTSTVEQATEHILVVWPRGEDGKADVDFVLVTGKSAYSYYRPNHEIDNLFSYSPGYNPPDDIETGIITDRVVYMGSDESELFVNWEKVQESEKKQSSQLDLQTGLSIEGSYMGASFKAEFEGNYGEGELSTHRVGFQESTEIKLHFAPLTDTRYEYRLKPFVYWSSRGGCLIVDWTVDLTGEWWSNTYNQPDLTFNLPHRRKECPGDSEWCLTSREETREITFQPADPEPGETVTVTAVARNYSLTDVSENFEVRFYRNDPDQGGVQIGNDFIAGLGSRLSATASTTFTMPSGGAVYVYAVADPDDVVTEIHEDNNRGYAVLMEGNLSVASNDIASTIEETPGLSDTVGISATIEATEGSAVNAPIRFWDGHPEHDGQTIGWDTIGFLTASETDVAHVNWDTASEYGTRTVCVEIEYEDSNLDDNLACTDIKLTDWPYHLYMPIVVRNN